jgi:hypothetical protein
MKIKIVNEKAWVVVTNKLKAKEIFNTKIFKLYFITSGLPVREKDLDTKKKIGIKVEWNNENLQYKEAIHLKSLGYNVSLELSCRVILSNK